MSEAPLISIAEINPPLPRFVADDELVSFLRMSDISENGGITNSTELPFALVKSGFTRFAEDDVLFAKITPCMENGKGAQALGLKNGIGCGSTEFHVLRARDGNCSSFIYQVLQSKAFRQKAETAMTGSAGQKRVEANLFREYSIYIPALSHQRRIAGILGTVDEAIEQTEALIAKQQQIKAGLMHDLFTRGLTPDGQLRPPQSEAPDLYQDSPLGWIPKEWSAALLDSVAVRGSGHTPNRHHPEYWNGGVKWISLADSSSLDRVYISDTEHEISGLGIANSSATMHPPGIVVLSRDAGVGKSAITTCEMAVSQHFMCWRCGPHLDTHFLYYWLQFRKREFENIATGSTIPTIGLRYFKHYRLSLPRDVAEQSRIGAMLLQSDTSIFAEETHLAKLRQLKQGLMHDLLTGDVPVSVPD